MKYRKIMTLIIALAIIVSCALCLTACKDIENENELDNHPNNVEDENHPNNTQKEESIVIRDNCDDNFEEILLEGDAVFHEGMTYEDIMDILSCRNYSCVKQYQESAEILIKDYGYINASGIADLCYEYNAANESIKNLLYYDAFMFNGDYAYFIATSNESDNSSKEITKFSCTGLEFYEYEANEDLITTRTLEIHPTYVKISETGMGTGGIPIEFTYYGINRTKLIVPSDCKDYETEAVLHEHTIEYQGQLELYMCTDCGLSFKDAEGKVFLMMI